MSASAEAVEAGVSVQAIPPTMHHKVKVRIDRIQTIGRKRCDLWSARVASEWGITTKPRGRVILSGHGMIEGMGQMDYCYRPAGSIRSKAYAFLCRVNLFMARDEFAVSMQGAPLSFSRRRFLKAAAGSALVLSFEELLAISKPGLPLAFPAPAGDLGVSYVDVASQAGLNITTVFGGEHRNKYLLETTGCGIAFYDYDNDGWLDVFVVNGWRLEGFPYGKEPTSHLFKNNRDGTFTDVTAKAGLIHHGWGQGVCIGDYDNDGFDDLFVSYFGKNVLYHNN